MTTWLRSSAARRTTALIVAGAFTLAFGGCSHGASSETAPESSIPPLVLAQRYADAVTAIPVDRYDLDARAAALPPGIDAAFAVARDEIGTESYSGALLGAEGAYENRSANSVDRAQLLAQLLAAKNVPVRYASCRLDATAAEALATRLFATPPAPSAAAPLPNISGDDAAYGRIRDRGNRDLAAVTAALGGAPAYTGTSHADLIAELEDHTWLQAKPAGTDWVDLDPSFADAVPGKSYCAPTATADAVPDSQQQNITIRVGSTTLDSGALSEGVLLEQTLPASTLRDNQIYLAQTSAKMAMDVGLADSSAYEPVLAIDGYLYPGKSVRFTDGPPGAAGSSTGVLDSVAGALAAETPSAASAPPSPGPYLVAEWLEFTVTLPNGKTDTTRRYLFDRGGSAWRGSADHDPSKLTPLRSDAHGPLAAQSVFQICVTAGRHDVRSYWQGLATFLKAYAPTAEATPDPAASGSAERQPGFLETMWPFWLRNFAVAMVSDERVIPELNDRPGVRFYADSPRIFVFGASIDEATGDPSLDTDLLRDPLRAVAADASGAGAVADGTLKFGIMEGALETEIAAPPEALQVAGHPFGSTSELLGPDGLAVLRPGDDLGAVSDPETAARIRAAWQNGATLVVPKQVLRGGPSGWWEVTRDGTGVRAIFDDLGGEKGPVKINPGGFDRGGKSYDLSNYGKKKPNFEIRTRGGSEYSALLIAILIVSAVVFVLVGVAVYVAITRKAQPELAK